MKDKLGNEKVLFANGLSYSRSKDKSGFEQALSIANQSDAVILCLGEEAIISGEAHCRAMIDLPGAQNELLKTIANLGKPIILFIMAGRPLAIGEIANYADAVLYAFHPGTMGGAAFADLLFGDEIPSGKLPVTFPKSSGQIPVYYNHKNTGRPADSTNWTSIDDIPVKTIQTSLGNNSHYLDLGYKPLYPFGYGLSYTKFEYSNLKIKNKEVENWARYSYVGFAKKYRRF